MRKFGNSEFSTKPKNYYNLDMIISVGYSLPNATYIGFTGTPVSSKDRSTREVFGDYIDVYDMTQAVEDGATRPVYYERIIYENTGDII